MRKFIKMCLFKTEAFSSLQIFHVAAKRHFSPQVWCTLFRLRVFGMRCMSQLLSLPLSKAIREGSWRGALLWPQNSRRSTKLSEFFDQSSNLSFVCALAGVETGLFNSPAILIASSLLEGNEGGDGNTVDAALNSRHVTWLSSAV